jgi:peptidoglycan hydrolase CwlO-like protein
MNWKKIVIRIGLITVIPATMLSMSACSSKITEEQLAQLQELRRQERSLQDGISERKSELSKIRDEINLRKTELKDCQSELDLVKQRLLKWPDVWPDYTPNK